MRFQIMSSSALLLLCLISLGRAVMNDAPKGRDWNKHRSDLIRREGTNFQRPGPPIQRGPVGGTRYHFPPTGSQVKRVYVPFKYGPPPPQAPLRRQYPSPPKNRYGPPPNTNRMRESPPPGWKSKRVVSSPPMVKYYGGPPRKFLSTKPRKPFVKNDIKFPKSDSPVVKTNEDVGHQIGSGSIPGSKVVYQVHKVPQTTYGIPHPTQGAPKPPQTSDSSSSSNSGSSSSFVHVYQASHNDDNHELEAKTSYSFGTTPEKHRGSVHNDEDEDDSFNVTASLHNSKSAGFQPPKETYGFQPYDDKDHFSLTPSHSFYSVGSQPSTEQESLSHNYFDQTH